MQNWESNKQHGVPHALWEILAGHRWHATSLRAFPAIVDHGAIQVCTVYNSLCKHLKAVSIFDFGPTAEDRYRHEHWSRWCGQHQAEMRPCNQPLPKAVGIWLRVRDAYRGPQFIDPTALMQRWEEKWPAILSVTHSIPKIMEGVEGGHVDELPITELDLVLVNSRCMTHRKVWSRAPAEIVTEVAEYAHGLPDDRA